MFEAQIDAGPLLSRCLDISLKSDKSLARCFASLCKHIAVEEGMDGKPLSEYVALSLKLKNNCRSMLQAVEAGQMLK